MRSAETAKNGRLLREMRSAKAGILAFLLLTACAGMTAIGVGCSTYGQLRVSMPELGSDAVSLWVADLDDAMTGACR